MPSTSKGCTYGPLVTWELGPCVNQPYGRHVFNGYFSHIAHFLWDVKYDISTRRLANLNQGWSHFPHNFCTWPPCSLSKWIFSCSLNDHVCAPPPLPYSQPCSLFTLERISYLKHVVRSFWNLLLESHLTTYHSNMGVSIRKLTENCWRLNWLKINLLHAQT